MKKQILIIHLIIFFSVFAQDVKYLDFKYDIYQYDLSNLFIPKQIPDSHKDFTIKPGDFIGFFGSNYQRFHIKFLSVKQHNTEFDNYLVNGKTKLKENICPFSGTMKIIDAKILEIADIPDFKQGYVVFEYEFSEDVNNGGTGYFKGKARSDFFIDKQNIVYYDAISFGADGYSNNQFEGVWISNNSGKEYKCNWGEFRIPDSGDLDMGAGEFSVDIKYIDRGWKSFKYAMGYGVDASKVEIEEAKMIEREEWWK